MLPQLLYFHAMNRHFWIFNHLWSLFFCLNSQEHLLANRKHPVQGWRLSLWHILSAPICLGHIGRTWSKSDDRHESLEGRLIPVWGEMLLGSLNQYCLPGIAHWLLHSLPHHFHPVLVLLFHRIRHPWLGIGLPRNIPHTDNSDAGNDRLGKVHSPSRTWHYCCLWWHGFRPRSKVDDARLRKHSEGRNGQSLKFSDNYETLEYFGIEAMPKVAVFLQKLAIPTKQVFWTILWMCPGVSVHTQALQHWVCGLRQAFIRNFSFLENWLVLWHRTRSEHLTPTNAIPSGHLNSCHFPPIHCRALPHCSSGSRIPSTQLVGVHE